MNFRTFNVVSPLSNIKLPEAHFNIHAVNYVEVSVANLTGASVIHMVGNTSHRLSESIETVVSNLPELKKATRAASGGDLSVQERRVHLNLKLVREIFHYEDHTCVTFLDGSSVNLELDPKFAP